ncbi:MAG TPA: TM0106 family RecB-like putative nuclease [Bryobacteraceae bacterium]|nr:TM0106 family RecB-like putative nuclease [Bryobacteraceae bacterium]
MNITSHLFEAYLKCPTKCFLRSLGETAKENEYANWVQAENEAYRSDGIRRLTDGTAQDKHATSALDPETVKSAKWKLAVDQTIHVKNIESNIHAVERVPSVVKGKPAQFTPIRFVFTNKLSRHDKLLLAFDALVLSETVGCEVDHGKIIHGDAPSTLVVKTSALASEVRKITATISTLLAPEGPPDLALNRHCADCEFQTQCRKKATDKDDLSLLSGIKEDERNRYRSKGIFTVTQLSYTFRPRRTPKRAKKPARPRYPALQALAIRENTIYIHGSPLLRESKAQVYLDIEGLPDSEFYYLIGALIVSEGQEVFQSFWADQRSQEPEIFAQFAEAVCQLGDFRVLHFGDYEAVALRRVKARLPESLHPRIDAILEQATNVLSVIHPHVYFPTYSNALKDIGRFLGFQRAHEDATGLQSILWRKSWNENRVPDMKARLLQYNQDDCRELKHVADFIRRVISPALTTAALPQTPFKTAPTEELIKTRPRWELFRPREYVLEDLEKVAKCAYFDYQRERVFVRTHPHLKGVAKKQRKASIRVNTVCPLESERCPRCQSKKIEQGKQMSHTEIDLKFFKGGVKKWVTRTVSWRYGCSKCKHQFSSEVRSPNPQRYGHGIVSWCVYSNVACGVNMLQTTESLEDVFGLALPHCQAYRWKRYMSAFYKDLYSEILQSILNSPVIHIDETTVRLRKQSGYVWVMTSIDKVYYFYKPSREGYFLQELLGAFSGVLVSDFYTAYDSLKCGQQKCLVHLVRDIDDDVMKNPLDTELKGMARDFGTLLRAIIETVDSRGLTSRYLRKHKRPVVRFLDSVASTDFLSPLANNYKRRFQKSGEKMFSFLDHDGVPWNNNNAEHAIKRFAKYRRDADGRFTERTLEEYLVLATVFETCEFNNVNVLKFLLSKETTLEGLLKMAGRKAEGSRGRRVEGPGRMRPPVRVHPDYGPASMEVATQGGSE